MKIHSIKQDEALPGIVIVEAEDGMQIRYRMGDDGVLRPGRVWACFGPRTELGGHGDYTVTLFIPLPDGPPELLKVEKRS